VRDHILFICSHSPHPCTTPRFTHTPLLFTFTTHVLHRRFTAATTHTHTHTPHAPHRTHTTHTHAHTRYTHTRLPPAYLHTVPYLWFLRLPRSMPLPLRHLPLRAYHALVWLHTCLHATHSLPHAHLFTRTVYFTAPHIRAPHIRCTFAVPPHAGGCWFSCRLPHARCHTPHWVAMPQFLHTHTHTHAHAWVLRTPQLDCAHLRPLRLLYAPDYTARIHIHAHITTTPHHTCRRLHHATYAYPRASPLCLTTTSLALPAAARGFLRLHHNLSYARASLFSRGAALPRPAAHLPSSASTPRCL